MKQYCKKLLALCISVSLCANILSGCGTAGSGADTDTQSSAETNETSANEVTSQTISQVSVFQMPTKAEESDIYVEPVDGISDDFIRGMDASSVLVEEKSGVKYYNYDGEEQDVFMTLAQSGVNYIRLRVWNDPYDADGNGYGGGNNDVATAIELGKRATMYGMKVCIDFHYSDFWADPKKQYAPKAWENMSLEEKSDALYNFTKDSLSQILDAGVDVGIVQIGNEINNGMSGETSLSSVTKLLISGSNAVREISNTYDKDIQIAVHYTNINDSAQIDKLASNLADNNVDYDIFAISYYSYWHGTIENMQSVVRHIQEAYAKKVMIAETAYCYTSEDGDGSGNSVEGIADLTEGYPATVQGQASMVRDICAAANDAGAIGVFYWEGTWIPVGDSSKDNSSIWEEYGSGWASSYAADYDPNDAGLYYGGCSWDNQAMFDFEGYPLSSLNVFKYLKYGTIANAVIDSIEEPSVTIDVGAELVLPEAVDVIYNDHSLNTSIPVEWYEEQLLNIDTSVPGVYFVAGRLKDEKYGSDEQTETICTINVKTINYVENPSFEDSDTSMWKVTYEGTSNPTDFQNKAADAYTGDIAFHFWSESDMEFSIEQEVTGLEPGTYQLSAYAQGGDMSDDSQLELYVVSGDEEKTESFMVTSYADWKNPTIPEIKVTDGTVKVGVRMKCNAKSWGTVDDFTLNKISD